MKLITAVTMYLLLSTHSIASAHGGIIDEPVYISSDAQGGDIFTSLVVIIIVAVVIFLIRKKKP